MNTVIQQLKDKIDKKHLLKHPFDQALEAGTLPVEVMQKYNDLNNQLGLNFPIFFSMMRAGSGAWEIRQAITNNLYDKEHANVWWNIIEKRAITPQKQLETFKAVQQGRDVLWGFLDGVCREYMPEMKC